MSHARMSEFMDIGRAIDRITNEVGSSLLGKENRRKLPNGNTGEGLRIF